MMIDFRDLKLFVEEERYTKSGIKHHVKEWLFAENAGWDNDEFLELYKKYLHSVVAAPATRKGVYMHKLKGIPLESLAHYFLKEGSIVEDIQELKTEGCWQVDGQGLLNKDAMLFAFGPYSKTLGPQLYMEAKNHNQPIKNNDFALHRTRMSDHCSNVGVAFSTSGYPVGYGKGIAPTIYEDHIRDIFHILFTAETFKRVVEDDLPPLFLFREAYSHATNQAYVNNKELQKRCSGDYCQEVAKQQFDLHCC